MRASALRGGHHTYVRIYTVHVRGFAGARVKKRAQHSYSDSIRISIVSPSFVSPSLASPPQCHLVLYIVRTSTVRTSTYNRTHVRVLVLVLVLVLYLLVL